MEQDSIQWCLGGAFVDPALLVMSADLQIACMALELVSAFASLIQISSHLFVSW